MRVQVGDPKLVAPLLEYFERQADCVAVQVGDSEVEVALLGSYAQVAHDEAVEAIIARFHLRVAESPPLHELRNGASD